MQADKKSYLLLLQSIPIGVAYCRMIFKDDEPVDWVFLDANSAYEKVTGLKDVINKKMTDVLPDIIKTNPEVIEFYGRIATTGKSDKFETYVRPLKIWLSISAYSPEKGYFVAILENITERKLAEKSLKESEEKYRSLVENAGEAIYIVQDGKIVFANDRCFEIIKYTREDLVNHNFLEFIHPDDRKLLGERYLARLRGEDITQHYSWRFIDKDGAIKWFDLRATLIQWEGRPATLNFSTDITAQKMVEDELKRSGRLMADIIDFLPDATIVVDRDQKVLFWNKAMEEMTGLPSSEMTGKGNNIYTIPFYGEARPGLLDLIFTDALKTRSKYPYITQTNNSLSTEVSCPALYNGKGAWVFAKASPLHDAEGNLIGAIESIRDITAGRNALEALRKNEEQYRLLADTAVDMIWTMDPELHFTYSSPSVKRMRGLEPEEAITQSLADMLTPESYQMSMQTLKANIKEIESGQGSTLRLETEVFRKDGSTFWAESLVRPFYNDTGQLGGYIGITRDITERMAAEHALKKSEEMYRTLFEHAGEGIFIAQDDKLKFVNEKTCQIAHRSKEELLSLPFYRFLHPADRDMVVERYRTRKSGKLEGVVYTFRLIGQDGSIVWVELGATFVEWEGRPATLNFITDITARKVVEDELKLGNRIMADVIDFLPDATFAIDKTQKVTFWNRAMEEMTGIPATEMIGKGDYAYAIPFYGEARPILLDTIWTDNHTTTAKYPFITHSENSLFTEVFCPALYNGKGPWVFAKASPLYDADGNLTGAIESVRDITSSKNAVEALRKSEEKYRWLVDTADDMIWTLDSNMRCTYVSPSVMKLRGFTPEEAIHHTVSDMMTPSSLQQILNNNNLQAGGIQNSMTGTTRIEAEIYRKDGSSVWTETVVRPILSNTGFFTGLIGITRDISERKAAEHALRESEEKFRRIFENSNDAIFISTREGKFTDANESMCRMFGYTLDEILKLPVIELYKNPSDRAEFQAVIEKMGSVRNYEIELLRKDGTIVLGMLNSTVRRDKTGNTIGYQGIFRDITDIKRLQDERQNIAKLESIGTLAGGIAHDFNNILQGILGNISLAMLETTEGDSINEYLKEAEKASLNARNLTYQFLTFSKGGSPIKKKVLLDACIKDAVTLALRGSNVNYSLSITPDLWAVDADEGQIGQVVTNIVINAQQAMPRGGTVEVNAENIELTGQGRLSRSLPVSRGNYVRIAVTDHGTGIPPEHIGNVFDPYFTTKQKGSGLGLATSYSIVRKHNGHIGVESTAGKGSTFYIYLPASKKELHRKTIKKVAVIKGSGTVLLMDDEDMVIRTAGKMLKKLGYDVEFSSNGDEAIKKYRTAFDSGNPFTLVILDLTIPGGMGGIETIQVLREINPQLKAIVSSGYADVSAMAEYSRYGFKGMVAKPYTPAQLSKVLSDVAKG